MNKKKRIYAVLEVKERELLGKILFAIKMSNLGYSVVIGKKNSLYNYQKYLKSGIYYFKGMGRKNIKPMKNLINNGHKVVGFDEEGMVAHEVSIIPNRVDKDCMKMVDFFFTVGGVQQNNTLKVYPEFKSKIFQIGNPRFDIMKKNNNNFYLDEVKEIKKKYGKFVLIATQLTLLNNYMIKDIFKFFEKKKNKQDNVHFFKTIYEFENAVEKKWKKFLSYFPKKYPDINILIKPHPVENRKYWVNLVKKIGCKNLVLASDKYLTNSYLIASELNVGSNCHTSLESYIAGKPSVNLRAKNKDSIYVSKLIRAVSSKDILSIKQLDKIIRDWFHKKIKFTKKIPKKNKLMLNNNVKNIHKESFYFFEKKIRSIKIFPKIENDKYTNFISFMYFRYLKKLKNLYYSINLRKEEYDFYKNKFSGLSLDEVNHTVEKYTNALNYDFKNFSVKELYPGCFSIERKS